MWGFSPAQDLLKEAPMGGSTGGELETNSTRVLVTRPGDIRHVMASISRRRRHSKGSHSAPVQFVVMEKQLEVIARHMLLLQIACDWELPIRQRATVFLEVFGNTLLQERTQRYVYSLGLELINLVCNGVGALADFVDLSLLKYRDRDTLVDIFHSWSPSVSYDIVNLRDFRLRGHYGLRYDTRSGVVDWDYHARVKPAAPVIHHTLYRGWRLNGVAFEFGDQQYNQPNRTLGSYAEGVMKKGKDKGLKKEIRGYWVDVANGPFVPFGVRCDKSTPHAAGLFDVQNPGTGVEQYRHHTVEIAVFNLLSYLWEIETGEPYSMSKVTPTLLLNRLSLLKPQSLCSLSSSPLHRHMTSTVDSATMRVTRVGHKPTTMPLLTRTTTRTNHCGDNRPSNEHK
jgi:dynein assembly factor 3